MSTRENIRLIARAPLHQGAHCAYKRGLSLYPVKIDKII